MLRPDWLLIAAMAVPESVVVMDLRSASRLQVEHAKVEAEQGGWWLELGDELVVARPATAPAVASDLPILRSFSEIDPRHLVMVGRGCAEPIEFGRQLASSGRWQLRAVDHDEVLPQVDEHLTIRPFKPNVALARQYRLDAGHQGAADPMIQQVVDRVQPVRWFGDVTSLAAFDRSSYATTSLFAARDWIAEQMQETGLVVTTPNFTMSSPSGTITRQNVLGTWTGTRLPEEWIIVGAHYDSRNANANSTSGTPGAEDNASGCAGVIELARALLPQQPERSVLFMCYAGEEQGLRGSTAHVQSMIAANQLSKVQAVVIMDMIGYSADAQLQVLYESETEFLPYLQRFGAAASTYVPQLNVVYSTNPFGSDHMPYLNAGVQTLLAIEDDWDVYPHYHRNTDTPANLGPNAHAMGGAILKTNAAVLADLVGLSPGDLFIDGFEAVQP